MQFLFSFVLVSLLSAPAAPVIADVATPIVVLGGEGVVSEDVENFLNTCIEGELSRQAGLNRYATAAAISSSTFPTADTVLLATGVNFPDALAAGPWAGSLGAPILLVGPTWIPAETMAELDRLSPSRTVILGGTGAVSADVEAALEAGDYGTVERVAGVDRYATAAAISVASGLTGDRVYVATGSNFPDALAGAGPGAINDAPILLVRNDSIPGATATELARLSPSEIVILGGTGVVSQQVEDDLSVYAATVRRLAGANRFGTAAAVSQDTYPASAPVIYVATGANYPDALAGGAPAGHSAGNLNGPTLLVLADRVPVETAAEIERLTGYSCPSFNATGGDFGYRLDGTGDDVPAAATPSNQTAIVEIRYGGTGSFIVWGLDSGLGMQDLLVNETGAYTGVRPVNTFFWTDPMAYLDITASGPWRIDVRSINFAPLLGATISGTSDAVVRISESGIANFAYTGSGNFIVWAHGSSTELVVLSVGDYDGNHAIPAGTDYLEILGVGSWTITYQ
jgi:putative cell wall-binding protein